MNMMELLKTFSIKQLALVIRCLLDRTPVIIGGPNKELINEILIALCDVLPMRKEVVYGNDFLDMEEYELIIEEEGMDYDNHRVVIRAPTNQEDEILSQFSTIKGWIIGMQKNGDINIFFEKANRLRQKSEEALFIILDDDDAIELIKYYGSKKEPDCLLERAFIKNAVSQTETALEKIRRVLDKKIQGSPGINESIITGLIDLDQEDLIIKENIFKKELAEFYQASRRALALLSRLNFLNQFHPVKIAKKTFFNAISCETIDISRLLHFIRSEWEEDFQDIIETSRMSNLGDHLDSLWG